jgi:DNA-binding NarL/FixJ family response regulator
VIDRNQLSPIKRQALDLLMEGLQNKEIAKRLGISLRTVKGYVAQFMEITDLTDRVRIVVREIINQPVLVN